jgi:hypothetical protein
MIENISYFVGKYDGTKIAPSGQNDWTFTLADKINELVDAVNKLQAAYEAGVKSNKKEGV